MQQKQFFVISKTVKDNYSEEDAAKFNQTMSKKSCSGKGAWLAPLAFWGVCTWLGVLVGIAGIACAGLIVAIVS